MKRFYLSTALAGMCEYATLRCMAVQFSRRRLRKETDVKIKAGKNALRIM